MRTIVETMLPQQFLFDLGVYMQTAAHIELAVWQTTMHAEGVDLHSTEEYRSYVALKLRTIELVSRFRASGMSCPPFIAERIRSVADQLVIGLETRNLAAHGAFYWSDQTDGTLGAAHYFARGRKNERELFEVTRSITRQQAEDALSSANQLLHEVIALRQMVIDWRYPDGMPDTGEPQTVS